MQRAGESGISLRTQLHAIKPVLSDLGFAFGEIGSFAKLAAASLPLFAASFAGKTLIDLTKFNEQLAVAKDRLQVLSRGPGAFQQVSEDAKKAGTSITDLAGAVEGFAKAGVQAQKAFGFVGDLSGLPGLQNFVKLGDALNEQLVKAGVNSEAATKATKEFGDALAKNGGITAEMVEKLQSVSPRVADNLAKVFNKSNADQWIESLKKAQASLDDIKRASFGPNFTQFFNPKPITEITGETIKLKQTFEELKETLAPTADEISTQFIRASTVILDAMKRNIGQIPQIVSSILNPALLFGPFLSGDLDFSPISTQFQSIMDSLSDIAQDAWDNVIAILNDPEGIDLSGLIDTFTQAFQSILSAAQSFWQQITSAAQQAQQDMAFAGPPSSDGGFFELPQLASGGLVRGPGTATSDSILARMSAGEFVMNAAATRHWGVQMLTALNNMRMPNLLPQSPLIPRFAGGGAVQTAGRAVHLHIGNQSFQLHGAADIVNRLERESSIRSLASTGIAQTWVGGRR
jgi:hypothetical protein